MSLSVIISFSPGRQANLLSCLTLLARQSLAPDAVWVECDGEEIALPQGFEAPWPLVCSGRPRDYCVARSRNLGASRSQHDLLVFLDCDVLLQPESLAIYTQLAQAHPQHAFYGSVTHQVEALRPSQFFPEQQVCAEDLRFLWREGQLQILPTLWQYPQLFAWTGNCCIPRPLFEAVGGFDAGFVGPGWEDVDFANRLLKAGFGLAFGVEAWAEHLHHAKALAAPLQKARNRARVGPLFEGAQVLVLPVEMGRV